MGLLKSQTTENWVQRIQRSHEAGRQLHAQNLAEQERILRETDAESNIIEIDNPEGGEGVADARVVSYEPLQGDDIRASEDLEDFGINPTAE